MAKVKGAVLVDVERCKGCELCIVNCPQSVLANIAKQVNSKGYPYVYMKNPDDCTGCTNCAVVCPDGVLTVYRIKT
jgi:2-oxoglutarate ferredoxin oxidoreductase subunit delta